MRQRESILAISSVALALAPKCPLCFLALAGAIGAATPWIAPLAIVSIALTISTVARRARLLAVIAGAAILSGRFFLDSRAMVITGAVALLIAALWPRDVCSRVGN
jgi:hypothetical protein